MKTRDEIDAEITAAIERCETNADPYWLREFLVCIYVAAVEKPFIQVDDVWAVFERRGSGLTTHNTMAAGASMRRAAKLKYIEKRRRPQGMTSVRNHNYEGTGYWASLVHEPGARVPDSYCEFSPKPPVQQDLRFAPDDIPSDACCDAACRGAAAALASVEDRAFLSSLKTR